MAGMARDGDDRARRLVHRLPPFGQAPAGLLLLYRKQSTLGHMGVAGAGLGPYCSSGLPVSDESQGLEKEYLRGKLVESSQSRGRANN